MPSKQCIIVFGMPKLCIPRNKKANIVCGSSSNIAYNCFPTSDPHPLPEPKRTLRERLKSASQEWLNDRSSESCNK